MVSVDMANEHSPVLSSLYPLHDLIMASTSSPKSDDFGTATCMEMHQLSFLLWKKILALSFQWVYIHPLPKFQATFSVSNQLEIWKLRHSKPYLEFQN